MAGWRRDQPAMDLSWPEPTGIFCCGPDYFPIVKLRGRIQGEPSIDTFVKEISHEKGSGREGTR